MKFGIFWSTLTSTYVLFGECDFGSCNLPPVWFINPNGGLLTWFLSQLYYHAIICRIAYSAHRNVCVCVRACVCVGSTTCLWNIFRQRMYLKRTRTRNVGLWPVWVGSQRCVSVCNNRFVPLLQNSRSNKSVQSRRSHLQNVPNFRVDEGYWVRQNTIVVLSWFIGLTMTTCFGRAWPSSGHKLLYI